MRAERADPGGGGRIQIQNRGGADEFTRETNLFLFLFLVKSSEVPMNFIRDANCFRVMIRIPFNIN